MWFNKLWQKPKEQPAEEPKQEPVLTLRTVLNDLSRFNGGCLELTDLLMDERTELPFELKHELYFIRMEHQHAKKAIDMVLRLIADKEIANRLILIKHQTKRENQ